MDPRSTPLAILIAVAVVAAIAAGVWLLLRRRRAGVAAAVATAVVTRPVVLVHGLAGFDTLGFGRWRAAYFRGVAAGLRARGVPVHTARLPAFASVPARAEALARFVRSLPHPRVSLIAHSMGGLDARYALSRLGLADRVAELVTIGTPHRGTPIAALVRRWPWRWLTAAIASAGAPVEALDWLTPSALERFAETTPDAPEVTYYCVVARASWRQLWRNPLLWACHLYLRWREGDSDGLVPVDSQRWGTCLGEVGADHWAQIGWAVGSRAPELYADIVARLRP